MNRIHTLNSNLDHCFLVSILIWQVIAFVFFIIGATKSSFTLGNLILNELFKKVDKIQFCKENIYHLNSLLTLRWGIGIVYLDQY